MKTCKTSFIILSLLLASLAGAQPLLPLNKAVEIALRENQNINIARQNDALAEARTNWGTAGLLPTLNATGSYSYSLNDLTQQVAVAIDSAGNPLPPNEINDASFQTINAGINLNYVLFDGLGRINNLRKLHLERNLSETQLRFTIENVLLQVFNTYYNTARQWHQLRVDQEALGLSQRRYQRTKAAYELGGGRRLDMLNAEVDLNTDSITFLNARRDYEKSQRQLNLLLNFPIDSVVKVDTGVVIDFELDFNSLRAAGLENNAALVQAEFNREISKKEISIARSNYMPEVSANGGYNYVRNENDGGFLLFSEQQGWQAGISVRWNLFNGYRTATEVQSAQIRLEQNDIVKEQARDQLELDLANGWIDYQTNISILKTQERNLGVAKLNFDRSQQAYELGQINSSQLREAQLNYIRAKQIIIDLRFILKAAEIDLRRIAGELIRYIP
jgi:outer membrane protein